MSKDALYATPRMMEDFLIPHYHRTGQRLSFQETRLKMAEQNRLSEEPLPRIDTDIRDYYRNIAKVVNKEADPIVTHDQQRDLMHLMEAIFESADKNEVVWF